MKAIETRYLGPTDHLGSRIKAFDMDGNSLTVPFPHESNDPHVVAAHAFRDKMGWDGELIGGATKHGYAFVFVDSPALDVCRAVLAWASTPGEHGGNPYCKDFVRLARKALGDS